MYNNKSFNSDKNIEKVQLKHLWKDDEKVKLQTIIWTDGQTDRQTEQNASGSMQANAMSNLRNVKTFIICFYSNNFKKL